MSNPGVRTPGHERRFYPVGRSSAQETLTHSLGKRAVAQAPAFRPGRNPGSARRACLHMTESPGSVLNCNKDAAGRAVARTCPGDACGGTVRPIRETGEAGPSEPGTLAREGWNPRPSRRGEVKMLFTDIEGGRPPRPGWRWRWRWRRPRRWTGPSRTASTSSPWRRSATPRSCGRPSPTAWT